MSTRRMRMIAAGAAVALLTGTAGAAAAATPGTASPSASASSPAPKPSPTGGDRGGKSGGQQVWLTKLAASLHVSVTKLESALVDAKQTIGRLGVAPTDPAVVAVVSHDLGISTEQATWLLKEVFDNGPTPGKGKGGSGGISVPDSVVIHTLAGILHIGDARAAQVLDRLERISQPHSGIPADDPQFRALAASLHITPQQLIDAIRQLKQDIAGSMPKPSSPPVPGKG